MPFRFPKQPKDWDKEDPIHINSVIALWCNINPSDLRAKEEAADEIQAIYKLFRRDSNFPLFRLGGKFAADSAYYLSRKDLKKFAKKVGQKPLFLFQKNSKKKKYNNPPKPYKLKFIQPDWEYIKRADFLLVSEALEMFFGKLRNIQKDVESFESSVAQICEEDIFKVYELFANRIPSGYFGDYNHAKNFIHSYRLSINKVFSFIDEKDIAGLVKSYGYDIDPGLSNLIEQFNNKEVNKTYAGDMAREQKETESTLKQTKLKNKGGRPKFPREKLEPVIEKLINKIPQKHIPYNELVIEALTGQKTGYKHTISDDEYHKRTGFKPSTVISFVRSLKKE